MMVSFKAKPFRQGGSWVITIPADYISNELVDPSKELKFEVTE